MGSAAGALILCIIHAGQGLRNLLKEGHHVLARLGRRLHEHDVVVLLRARLALFGADLTACK